MALYDDNYLAGLGMDYDRNFRLRNRRFQGNRPGYGNQYRTGGLGSRSWNGYGDEFTGYDRDFQRMETDTGDPFGDRTRRTPIRMIRGEFHAPYGGEYSAYGRDYTRMNYGGEYTGTSMDRGLRNRGYGNEFRGNWRSRDQGYGNEFGGWRGTGRNYGRSGLGNGWRSRRWW